MTSRDFSFLISGMAIIACVFGLIRGNIFLAILNGILSVLNIYEYLK